MTKRLKLCDNVDTAYTHKIILSVISLIKGVPSIQSRLLIGVGTTDTKLPTSGCQEYDTGASVELAFPSHLGQHSLGAGCHWRQMYRFSKNVPLSIRQQAGHSLKSFIKVSVYHSEDNLWNPFSYG